MAEQAQEATNKQSLLLVSLAVVLAIGASIGGTLYFVSGDDSAPEPAAEEAPAAAIYHNLRPAFIVNYVTGSKPRYMQTDLTVMARDPQVIRALVNHGPLVRSRILGFLTDLDFYELQTDEGKEAMRVGLKELINRVLTEEAGVGGIESVLLNNFVMQ